ncbi:hypothetical protein OG299_01725 [Streptomyces sp. NBC_01296]|nr:hypothetical protein OG299_01725 [Streptomyces sp. NBC_01296]
MLVFTPSEPGGQVLFQNRRGALIQDAFPDLVAAAGQLTDGLVLDGEVVAWDVEAGALSCNAGPPTAPATPEPWPPACPPSTSPSTSSRPTAPS